MPDYPLILERLLNVPLLAHPDKAMTVAGVVLRNAGIEVNVAATAEVVNAPKPVAGPAQEAAMRGRYERDGAKPFLFADGVAVIEVTGSLAHRQWHIGRSSGVMGYDGIGAQFDAALIDPAVKAILFDEHSAGGEVSGCFQLADRIFQARGQKPIVAVADEMAFSAAFALGAACDELWLASDTAAVGSVGAAMVHFSFEKYLEGEGVTPTLFQSGARKMEGNPLKDLTPEAVERFQARIDAMGRIFEARVASWRSLSEEAVRDTQADTFMGREAVDIGFADGIATPVEIFTALAEEAGTTI